jgi:DnaJ family protein A protein 5
MGAQQSTGAGGHGGGDGAQLKTSYYELLGVARTATDDEIKKGYRRKALELHPDRNYGDVERTTALFADVSTAYEVLSDPQERAWYDAHEADILRGGDGGGGGDGGDHYEYNMKVTTAEDISRMMGKFRSNIDFTDSPTGFFGFVRETFEQLAREEERAADYEGVQVKDYPSFGHHDDTYESGGVVRNFYNVWAGFATVKSFASLDMYRTADAPDRRVRRLMEKENQKLREKGVRDFNAAVQTLVAFVRKRDPRYTPNLQTEEQKAKAQREARKQQQERARAANAAKIQDEADVVPEWAQVQDPEELLEESDEEVEEEHFECVACRKTFKSERQWEAHEKSKKHQKAIYALKKKMQKDNDFLNLDEDVTSSGAITPALDDDDQIEDVVPSDEHDEQMEDKVPRDEHNEQTEDGDPDDADTASASLDAAEQSPLGDKPPNANLDDPRTDDNKLPDSDPSPPPAHQSPSGSDDSDDDEYASRSDIEARLASYRLDADTPATSTTEGPPDDPPAPPLQKKLGAAALKRAKRAAKHADGASDADAEGRPHRCLNCNAGFPSKTKLFEHIKESGHAAPISATKGAGGKKGKKR